MKIAFIVIAIALVPGHAFARMAMPDQQGGKQSNDSYIYVVKSGGKTTVLTGR